MPEFGRKLYVLIILSNVLLQSNTKSAVTGIFMPVEFCKTWIPGEGPDEKPEEVPDESLVEVLDEVLGEVLDD